MAAPNSGEPRPLKVHWLARLDQFGSCSQAGPAIRSMVSRWRRIGRTCKPIIEGQRLFGVLARNSLRVHLSLV